MSLDLDLKQSNLIQHPPNPIVGFTILLCVGIFFTNITQYICNKYGRYYELISWVSSFIFRMSFNSTRFKLIMSNPLELQIIHYY